MEVIYVLIPLSLMLIGLAIFAFSWATKSGQFDDLDSPALSILDDESQADDAFEVSDDQQSNIQ